VRRVLFGIAAASSLACGRGAPPPPAAPTFPTAVVVFYDENGNGRRDADEVVRLPNVLVQVGAANARTDAAGRAAVSAAAGPQTVSVDPSSLPAFYEARPVTVTVPSASETEVAASLPIHVRTRNTYMGIGDSITSDSGYLEDLRTRLTGYFGAARTLNEGLFGTRSFEGAYRIDAVLAADQPAYTLILYGTNDWNEKHCQSRFPCYTIDSLRLMVHEARAAGSLPFLATLPPVNEAFPEEAPPERNDWIARMNALIRDLAPQEGAVLVDLHKAYLAEPDRASLFRDYIHPSEAGRVVIARTFFEAIVRPR
jgi:lysophospholipase L1-like esterase